MKHSRQQELRDIVNEWLNDESDSIKLNGIHTASEMAFCIMYLNSQEEHLILDFCENVTDDNG